MPSRDYEEFLESFNARGVRYLVIGAHAVAFHALPRATKDLDLFIEPTPENANRALAAIRDFFGGVDLGFTVEDLTNPDLVVQLGITPSRIDLLPGLSGVADFPSAWERRVDSRFGEIETHFISLDDLIREKESAGRPQDLVDLRALRRARPKS